MKIVLKKPVVLTEGGTPVATELNFREEVVSGDLRGIKASALADPTMGDILTIGGRLCGQPDAVMNKLGLADLGEVIDVVYGFMHPGRETGTAPSP